MKLLVILAVGLRPKDLQYAPRLSALANDGFQAPLQTIFPAVTCSVQASFLTGKLPSEHGIVANGWYFRDLSEVWLWRQSNRLVQGEKFYELALKKRPDFSCAKMFWWYNMYAQVSACVTPRPEYHADGLKVPGLYSEPQALSKELEEELGSFPLFNFWGPAANIKSSQWIIESTRSIIKSHDPDLALCYAPNLDYDHQRFGPDAPESIQAVKDLDSALSPLIDEAQAQGREVIVLSEYGIEAASRPIFLNRLLHEHGYLKVVEPSQGQLLDFGASRAFVVADHQVAHVYVRNKEDLEDVRRLLAKQEGVARVYQRSEYKEIGLDHERSGDLICESEESCWFAYHYWLDEDKRPDFANTVDIHRKPGYDPTELFLDPKLSWPKLRIAKNVLKKKLGFRYLMDVIGTDPSLVKGTHGRIYSQPELGPVFISSSNRQAVDKVGALDVSGRILDILFNS